MRLSLLCMARQYLLHYAFEHVEFSLPELRSLCRLQRINLPLEKQTDAKSPFSVQSPFVILSLSDEDEVRSLVRRSVLVRDCYELWAHGETMQQLHSSYETFLPLEQRSPFLAIDKTLRLRVESFGKSVPFQEQISKIEQVASFMNFKGSINLKTPDCSFTLMENYGHLGTADVPHEMFLGRWICGSDRKSINVFNLRERYFIGNTSMDPTLAMLMANQALVQPGDLVFDPFVGTGSILVAAAHFGAYCAGADIDITLLRGYGKSSRHKNKTRERDESIRKNFELYGFADRFIDVWGADFSQKWPYRLFGQFDAIVTDPPYGVREPHKRHDRKAVSNGLLMHQYNFATLFTDLLDFSARALKVGGRLVFWLPVHMECYDESAVPRHPCMRLEANCLQSLHKRTGRRLITLEKQRECSEGERATINEVFYVQNFRELYFGKKPTANLQQQVGVGAMSNNKPAVDGEAIGSAKSYVMREDGTKPEENLTVCVSACSL